MNPEIIFKLVFLAQIVLLSYVLPRNYSTKLISNQEIQVNKEVVSRYLYMNYIVALVGLTVLVLMPFYFEFLSLIYLLLLVGIIFLVQLLPIMFNKQLLVQTRIKDPNGKGLSLLLEVVHPITIAIACVMFLVYLAMNLVSWSGKLDAHLLHIAIFTGVNIYLTIMIWNGISGISNAKRDDRFQKITHFAKTTPFFFYISIGVSLYYFGKYILINLEHQEYRPVLMSVFIQFLALLIFNRMSFGINTRKT